MFCKIHETQNSTILACCDKELIGKTLQEGNYDVTIEESFYKGELITQEKLEELLQEVNNANLFGKKTISIAIKQGFLTQKDLIKIKGIEHAIILKV